ncbi:helix-turn-helix transcriptional regulator [Kutzneria buriramensis]|uniref:Helix-turn-helix protein n=1 Tax=Kutzneria buriramensis TaxID=1045776 RepID=A0A3E0G3T6_9PSEU|nr:helix-turn-helix protein [Kutzneria buriramensis]
MLRIHFTSNDLARTRVASTPDPLWEVLLSSFRLRQVSSHPELNSWARQLRTDQTRRARLGPGVRLLSVLAPMGPYIPDFLTPPDGKEGLDAGLEAIMSTPRRRLRGELARLARRSPLPGWVRPLSEGDVTFLRRLTVELRAYHDSAIAPHQEVIQRSVDADRARRYPTLAEPGIEDMFSSMGPDVHWRPPVLEVNFRIDKDLHLDGRGLRIVPSFFSRGTIDSLADTSLAPVLIFPIDHGGHWAPLGPASGRQSLEALMGANRAAVLCAVGTGATTSQLAHRLSTSLASVSRHTAVLRDAGLITTHRTGRAVVHALTPLGAALLGYQQLV